MTPAWVPLLSALLAVVAMAAQDEGELSRCAEVWTSSRLVVLGSEFTASCMVRPDCPALSLEGGVTNIELHLGSRLLARSGHAPVTHGNSSSVNVGNVTTVTAVVANFTQTRAWVTCCIQTSPCQLVGGVEVQARLLPVLPEKLGCQTNLTSPSSMTCSWDPGHQNPMLPTQYTLYTCISEYGIERSYPVPVGVQRVVIPRKDFILFSEMKVWVVASTAVGVATSDPITVEPMSSARFDPPQLKRVWPEEGLYGCLQLYWGLFGQQNYMSLSRMTMEARIRSPALDTSTWTLATFKGVNMVCELLHGTQYQVQIRTCYQGSPWSGWSQPQSGHTLEKVPVGRLDYWVKVPERKGKTSTYHDVRLFWKPTSQFRSNGRALSYMVSLPTGGHPLCSTAASSCDLHLSRKVKKVYLWAKNSAGMSASTEVPVLPITAHSAICDTVVSRDDRSLLVQWRNCTSTGPRWTRSRWTKSRVTDYVVNWQPMFKTNSSLLFEVANRNQSSVLLTGLFEPYQPYEVSVYPRFKNAVGLPKTVTAYSRQKAPSLVPDLKVRFSWGSVELTWEELPLHERNGIITGYQLYYWEDPEHITVVKRGAENRMVLLRGLSQVTSYSVLLAASTDGGTNNGSIIIFKTLAADASDVGVVVAFFFIGLSLVTIITFILFSYQKCVMVWLFPTIPDPASSSIKNCTTDMRQELSWGWPGDADPPVEHLSYLSLMEVSEKKMIQQWSDPEDTSDLGESLCGSPVTPNFPVTPCGSVCYATVICSCPYTGQPASPPPAYLRSESTQPLLESESYHNMATADNNDDVIAQELLFFGQANGTVGGEREGAGSDAGSWMEFPMLQGLVLSDAPE